MQATDQDIRQFIDENFLFGEEEAPLAGDDSFLDAGIIDSTGVLELVAFLEERFKIRVEDQELIPENLDSIDRLLAFVETKVKQLGE